MGKRGIKEQLENEHPEVLKREEAAELLRFSVRKLDYLTATGQLPHRKAGRSVRFSRTALLEWAAGDCGV